MKLFIHRSGRTARAGKSGTAYVLLTPNELPFMVDTNLHVGRKFESDMTKYTEEEKAKLIQEPLVSLYGQINQSKINEYLTKYEYEQGDLFKTMQNAMQQFNKHKSSASTNSVRRSKELVPIPIHPYLQVDDDESTLMKLQHNLRAFRPKYNAIEL